jgi:hypothetical protein
MKGLPYVRKRFNRSANFTWIVCVLFTGADLPAVDLALQGFSAEGADRAPFVEKAPMLNGGACGWLQSPPMAKRRRESLGNRRDSARGGPSLFKRARHT